MSKKRTRTAVAAMADATQAIIEKFTGPTLPELGRLAEIPEGFYPTPEARKNLLENDSIPSDNEQPIEHWIRLAIAEETELFSSRNFFPGAASAIDSVHCHNFCFLNGRKPPRNQDGHYCYSSPPSQLRAMLLEQSKPKPNPDNLDLPENLQADLRDAWQGERAAWLHAIEIAAQVFGGAPSEYAEDQDRLERALSWLYCVKHQYGGLKYPPARPVKNPDGSLGQSRSIYPPCAIDWLLEFQ